MFDSNNKLQTHWKQFFEILPYFSASSLPVISNSFVVKSCWILIINKAYPQRHHHITKLYKLGRKETSMNTSKQVSPCFSPLNQHYPLAAIGSAPMHWTQNQKMYIKTLYYHAQGFSTPRSQRNWDLFQRLALPYATLVFVKLSSSRK